jgi:DnaJ-class molecular chaperone
MSPDLYALFGLSRHCTPDQIRSAYRILAKRYHPDLNSGSQESIERTQELNAAYEILCDPERRRLYDASLEAPKSPANPTRQSTRRTSPPISKEVLLSLAELFHGTTLTVQVNDPGNGGEESYPLEVPPSTAPGTRFRIRRNGATSGGQVVVRVKARPDSRFKIRGFDLRCDLRIQARRAAQGGWESVRGVTGNSLRISIPIGVARGDVVRVEGEGLPKPRGGRGDLLVRIQYTPEVRITRTNPSRRY